MGTNYYVQCEKCDCCGHKPEDLHIGKSSAGWTFSFNATEEIISYEAWIKYLIGKTIVDEYGHTVSILGFIRLIESKRDEPNKPAEGYSNGYSIRFLDDDGNSFTKGEFF